MRALATGARRFLGDVQRSMEEAEAEELEDDLPDEGRTDHAPHRPGQGSEPTGSTAAAAAAEQKGSMSHVDAPGSQPAVSSSGRSQTQPARTGELGCC